MRPDMNDKPGWYPASGISFCRGTACRALKTSGVHFIIRLGGSRRQTINVIPERHVGYSLHSVGENEKRGDLHCQSRPLAVPRGSGPA